MFNKKDMPQNLRRGEFEKTIAINNSKCTIKYEDALFADINGESRLLDEPLIANTINELARTFKTNSSKYLPIPRVVTISNKLEEATSKTDNVKSEYPVILSEPKWDLSDIYLPVSSREMIDSITCLLSNREKIYGDWGLQKTFKDYRPIILNFYGKPGTGKTITAEAIAKQINKKYIAVNYAELESKFVGDTPKNIKNIFSEATKDDAVIIFNEADSFLGKRISNVQQSADHGINIARSVLLLELESFNGIVIFTTNLISNYDAAFKRRILASVEFSLPDAEGREFIWDKLIPDKLPLDSSVNSHELAARFDNVTGADIKDILLNSAIITLQSNSEKVDYTHFTKAYQYVMNRYSKNDTLQGFKITTERVENIDE